MADQVRKFLAAPSFDGEVDAALALHAFTLRHNQLPWVFSVAKHVDPSEPTVFARFLAFDRSDGRVYIVRGLLAEPLAVVQVTVEIRDRNGSLREVRATDMRIKLGDIRDAAVAVLEMQATATDHPATAAIFAPWAEDIKTTSDRARTVKGRRGRPPVPDDRLELVARTYLELFNAGWRNGIRQELAGRLSKRLGKPVPIGTADDWLERARTDGWLRRGGRGRAGARPGPKLEQKEEGDG